PSAASPCPSSFTPFLGHQSSLAGGPVFGIHYSFAIVEPGKTRLSSARRRDRNMAMHRSFHPTAVRFFCSILGGATLALAPGSSAEDQQTPDWEKQVAEAQKAVGQLSAKLIAAAEDPKSPEEDRWRAVAALGRLGDRASLEYLIDRTTLRLHPPDE